MARFRFNLQKVLEAREALEQKARREFGEAQRRLLDRKKSLNNIISRREQLHLEMSHRRKQKMPVRFFKDDIDYDFQLKLEIKSRRKQVDQAAKELEKKRRKLLQAMKDRKMMEKLRERRLEEFKKEIADQEAKFADDLAGRKAFFSGRGEFNI